MANSANKRTPLQREADLAFVIELLGKCRTQVQITEELNKARRGQYQLSRVQVRADIKKAIAEITARNTNNTINARALAAEWQLNIAKEALSGYDRSCNGGLVKTISESVSTEGNKIEKKRIERTGKVGGPRYLSVAIAAFTEHARLLGLHAAPLEPDGSPAEESELKIKVTVSSPKNVPPDLDDVVRTLPNASTEPAAARPAPQTAGQGRVIIRSKPSC
jgi:hypothetical protein